MNKIKFTLAWDKLKDPVFTTIRSWNSDKEDYYRGSMNQEFSVQKVHNPYSYTSGVWGGDINAQLMKNVL